MGSNTLDIPNSDHFIIYERWNNITNLVDCVFENETEVINRIEDRPDDVIKVMQISPAQGTCKDVTKDILTKIAETSLETETAPTSGVRQLLNAHSLEFYDEDEDAPRSRSDYAEHNTLNHRQQF